MHLVDDRLALKALEGWRLPDWGDEVPVTTWLAHARLVRALVRSSTAGSLSREAFHGALEAALSPPTTVLRVLDPRPYTADAAQLAAAQSIPLLPAEMLMVAIRNGASVHVHSKNYTDKWDSIVEGTEASIRVYQDSDLAGSP